MNSLLALSSVGSGGGAPAQLRRPPGPLCVGLVLRDGKLDLHRVTLALEDVDLLAQEPKIERVP